MKRPNSSSLLVFIPRWVGSATLRVAAVGALALSGCASTGKVVSGPVWDADSLVGTMWTELCPGGDPEQTWIAFYDDGTFAYLYPDEAWEYDGDETWAVQGGELVVAWNNGFASTRYALSASSRLDGKSTKTCPTITLDYAGPAPDLDWTEKDTPAPEDNVEPEAPLN